MGHGETSLEFLRAFCAGEIDVINSLLTDDFRFEGPLYVCDTRTEYIRSLRGDPPESDSTFEVERMFENGEDVCLLYRYRKPQKSLRIAQWNHFRGDKIERMVLIFDSRESG